MSSIGSNVDVRVSVKNIQELKRLEKQMGRVANRVNITSTGVGSLGNKLGFAAFQFTFLAGIAGRALQEITGGLQRMAEAAAQAEDEVVRAIAQSGLDITRNAEGAGVAIEFLNDAIRDLGSGRTIFGTKEVAEAAKEIGRAFTFVGTQEQIAAQNAAVLQANLRLMTIEQIGAEQSAVGLAKVMKQFSKSAEEAVDVVNTLVIVNQQSSITLDGLIKSLGFAGGFATEAGISLKELAVILGVLQDRLGRKGGGPGQNFRVLLENFSRLDTARDLAEIGIAVRDTRGQMRPFFDILSDVNDAMKAAGPPGAAARQAILEQATASVRSRTALLNLTQGFDDLVSGLERVEDTKVGERLELLFTETAEARIKRAKNAIEALKIDLISGLSPAITEIITSFREIIGADIGDFFKDIGKQVGENIIPLVQIAAKLFKILAVTMKKNVLFVDLLVKAFIGLISILAVLFIIGSIGALVFALAAGFQRLVAFLGISSIATIGFVRVLLPLVAIAVAFLVILKAIDNILGLFKDGLQSSEIPALALNAALILLGGTVAALSLGFLRLGGLGAAVRGLGAAFSITGFMASVTAMRSAFASFILFLRSGTILASLRNAGTLLGGAISGNFLAGAARINPGIASMFLNMGKGIPIIAAIATAAILIGAFTKKMLDEAKESAIFGTGLVDLWDVVGFKIKVAITKTLFEIGKLFVNFGKDLANFFIELGGQVGAIIKAALELDPEALFAAIKDLGTGFTDIFAGIGDLDFLGKEMIRKIIEGAKKEGVDPFSQQIQEAIQEAQIETLGFVTDEEVRQIIEELFPFSTDPKAQEVIIGAGAQAAKFTQAQADRIRAIRDEIEQIENQIAIAKLQTVDPASGQIITNAAKEELLVDLQEALRTVSNQLLELNVGDFLAPEEILELFAKYEEKLQESNESLDELVDGISESSKVTFDSNELIKKYSKEVDKVKKIIEEQTGVTLNNIDAIETETNSLGVNTATLDLDTEKLGPEIVEIARNTNRLGLFSIVIDRAAIAFSLLAREGAEAARRLSTLKVSKKGVFSISGLATEGVTPAQVAELGSDLETLKDALQEDTEALLGFDAKEIAEEIAKEQFDSSKIQKILEDAVSTDEMLEALKGTDLDRLAAFSEVLRALELTDAQIKLLLDDISRTDDPNFKTLREIIEQLSGDVVAFIGAIIGRVPELAHGGIVTKPTLARLGESGAEAIIPLSGEGGIGGTVTNNITVNVEGLTDEITADEVAEKVVDQINNSIKGRNLLRR